ncbi:MAG: energy-coupling factor ABC transporter permease [Spirochaetaceae bacterium]|nr:energy-coupling factor ABC transporter permease [Spirochaetaceae bacterium]
MADALLSPPVGGLMLAAGVAAIGVSVKKIGSGGEDDRLDEKNIPMMGVMGAFVFAGQMINFTIPGTGSSGHIGGGMLLAAILGPFPAIITLASVLLIQCLFFADGGLLAYGCNVINMAVIPCLLAFPFIYKPIVAKGLNKKTITLAAVLSVVIGLQLGAFGVVLETLVSGITELPFGTFVLLMQPIHLAIGLVEGIVTAAVLCFVHSARPELLESAVSGGEIAGVKGGVRIRTVVVVFAVLSALVAGGLSILASSNPDGLEWAMEKTAGTAELEREGPVFQAAADTVEKTAFLPDYALKNGEGSGGETALAGIVGSVITVVVAGGAGLLIHTIHTLRKKKAAV